ncbi:phage tail spike protein [Liquorilactobacillus nagelii]|uniref:phage tail spike protein n=1 Tax=Liquorilactobacillus nagelii TaxID=82688 RepID=UPI0039E8C010
MSVPVLYEANATDFFNKGLGTLPDALTSVVTEERNGEFIFEMTYPADGVRADLLENNRIIKVDAGHVLTDQRFVIKKTTPQMSEDGKIYIDVYAEHISYITNDLALKPSVTVSGSANDAMQQWQKAIIDSNEITADSDITTSNSTAWTIDKVQTARQALGGVDGSILDVWGGEYLFDNLHISLKKQRGSSASTLLAYGRNIISFQQEENIENTYTSIYPYATLNSASGDTSSLYTIDNYVVDSQYVGNYPNRKILPVDFSSNFENVKVGTKASDASDSDTTVYMTVAEVQSQLKALAQQYITNNDVGIPTVSISVSFVDLSKTSNYADVAPLEQLDLCDIVPVRFTKLGIDTTAKVTHAEWNVLTDSYDKIELGSITPTLGQTLNTLTTVAQAAKQVAQDAQNNATIAWQSADGKTTTFKGSSSQAFPTAQHIGDLYWRENGDTTEVYIWDGSEWAFQFSNKTGQNISEAVDKAMAEADTATRNANAAVETGNQALTKAQTGIDAANAAADNASTANANASAAISNAATAIQQAQSAASDATSATNIANAVSQSVTNLKDGSTMTIAKLESGLALKITKDDMNTALQPYATQSWTSTEISATADEINSSIASVKKTADGNTTDVTSLKQRADGFDTSISNLSTNKADQTWTTNQIKASADSLNVTIASVQTQVDNSAVGTNLLLNSGNGWVGDPSQSPRLPDSSIVVNGAIVTNSDRVMKITAPDSGEFFYRFSNPDTSNTLYGLTAGQTYTISGLANLTNGQLNFRAQTVNGSGGWNSFTGSQSGDLGVTNSDGTTFTKFSYTFTIPSVATGIYISLQAYNVTYNTSVLSFKQLKLELGSHATDYSANPADNATVTSVTAISATVNGLQTTVSKKVDNDTYQTQITQFSNQIATKVESSTYNSKMTQLDNAISSKVSSSDYNSKVTQLSDAINLKVSTADWQNSAVGINLVPNSNADASQIAWAGSTHLVKHAFYYSGTRSMFELDNSSTAESTGSSPRFYIQGGTKYTLSFYAFASNNMSGLDVWLLGRPAGNTTDGYTVAQQLVTNVNPSPSGTQYYSITFTCNSAIGNAYLRFDNNGSTNGNNAVLFWNEVKIETGSTATPWCPAASEIANYSQIQQLSDNINLRVQKNDVINQINVSSEGILIDGAKVHITGTTTIDNAVIKSAMIDSISADKITAGTLNAANVNVINLNANNISSGTLTGVSFHQSSSGHDTWIDSNGIHDYDGSGNNAWIQKGTLQVYDSSNQGIFMQGGKLILSKTDVWSSLASISSGAKPTVDDYGIIESGVGIGLGGIKIHGTDSALLTDNSGKQAGVVDAGYWGIVDGAGFAASWNLLQMSGDESWMAAIQAGKRYGTYFNSQPCFRVGTAGWPGYTGSSKDVGQNVVIEANGIWLNSNGETHIDCSNFYFAGAHCDGGSLYTSSGDGWWMRNKNGSMATIHVQSVSQSSLLSLKTNLNKLDPAQALATLTSTDIYSYNYKSDLKNGISKTYATPIIDNVNSKPQYNIPYDFISADGTGRDDGTILGYAVAAIKELNSKISSLEAGLKQLKENAA